MNKQRKYGVFNENGICEAVVVIEDDVFFDPSYYTNAGKSLIDIKDKQNSVIPGKSKLEQGHIIQFEEKNKNLNLEIDTEGNIKFKIA